VKTALIERIRDFETVINIRSSAKFTAGVFAACPRMKLLSIWGTGTDNVDLAAAAKHGVTVVNTPGVSAPAIAEHSLMLMLAVARRVIANHNGVLAGQWPRGQAALLHGKTLGVIGPRRHRPPLRQAGRRDRHEGESPGPCTLIPRSASTRGARRAAARRAT
jgi:phosphoglycerate dehydrogenase-like enzyme